jgi:hypothetical protein
MDAPALHRFVQTGGETRVPIMQQKLVILIAGKRFPELLQRPVRRGMFSHIEMNQTSGLNLEGNKHIKDPEPCRNSDEEVASYKPMGMISQKG